MQRKKIIFILAGLVVLFLLIIPMIKSRRTIKLEYVTVPVHKDTVTKEVTATGTINPVVSVDVGTQVSGIISKIFVDFNDMVKKDQIIALIDTTSLHASVVDAHAMLLKAQAQLVQQQKEYYRDKDLLAKKAISQSDFDLQNANYLAAEGDMESAQATLNKAITNIVYATIRTPIDGIVIARNYNVGQTVAASFATPTLFTIANDLSKMQVEAHVDEADIGQVRIGQPAAFTVDAYPDESFHGIVKQVRLQPNTSQNVVTYTVIIDAPNPDLKLLPGMNSDVSIVVKEDKDVLVAPMAALRFSPNTRSSDNTRTTDTVWTLQNNDPVAIAINKGIDNGNISEISGNKIHEGLAVIIEAKAPEGRKYKTFLPTPPKRRPPRPE